MSVQLGISIHPSFLELALVSSYSSAASSPFSSMESVKVIDFQRKFLGKTTLTEAIQSFFQNHDKIKIKKVFVSSRYLEKVLDVKLGGSVAQIVTAGFENWSVLRQPPLQTHFDILSQRAAPLASQELIFGVKERVTSQGEILLELEESEMELIHLQLQTKNVKRICIHLLFSNKNPIHQKRLKDFFINKGYEVFSEDLSYSFDEMFSWRRNVLNACLAGVQHELTEELFTALEPWASKEKIYFAHERGIVTQPSGDSISALFAGLAYAFSKKFKKNQTLVHLGIEKWIFFDFSKPCDHWDSPWGPIGIRAPFFHFLSIQPTQEILLSPLGGLTHSLIELGYEPGPVLFGKAHRPTVFDILLMKNHPKNIEPFVSRSSHPRLEASLKLLVKGVYNEFPLEASINDLKDQILHQIMHQIELFSESNEVIISGPFAALFVEKLNKRNSRIQWTLAPYWDEIEPIILSQLKVTR